MLLQAIAVYCALSGYAATTNQLFILIVSLPRSTGGFAFGPQQIGALQNVAAVALMFTNFCCYTRLTSRFGYVRCFKIGWALSTTGNLLFPLYGLLADPDVGVWRYVPLAFMQFCLSVGGGMMFPTAFAFINRASAGLDRGAVNGWANSFGALCRAILPPAASWLLTAGHQMNGTWGRYFPVYINCFVGTLLLAVSLPGLRKIDGGAAHQVSTAVAACVPSSSGGTGTEPFLEG